MEKWMEDCIIHVVARFVTPQAKVRASVAILARSRYQLAETTLGHVCTAELGSESLGTA